MNTKIFTVKKILVLSVLFVISSQVFAGYSGGIGSQTMPFQISKTSDWQFLMSAPSDWTKYFILTADLNLAGINVTPIGNSTNKFTGVFDGNGHVIRNVTINTPNNDNVGLFGYLQNAKISNLGIEDANIIGRSYVGAMAGYCNETSSSTYSVIDKCFTTGKVTGTSDSAGGLIGYIYNSVSNYVTVEKCYSTCDVIGQHSVGGLVGSSNGNLAYFNSIYDCYAAGNVSSSFTSSSFPTTEGVGGLIGSCYDTYINRCYSAANVASVSLNAGGLVGFGSYNSIYNCYATGNVQSSSGYTGGLVGYSTSGSTYLYYSYSTGLVTAAANKGGGLIGSNSNSCTACFWDTQTSGKTVASATGTSTGIVGKTTAEMKTLSTFASAGWEIADINGPDRLWTMPENDYPKLSSLFWTSPAELTLSGDGSTQNPYQIWTNDDFVTLSENGSIWDKHLILMADLDLSGVFFRPIGNSMVRFTGTFDGQGFTIKNAQMNFPQKDYVAIFGFAGKNANIENLNIQDANITSGKYTAALIANNYYGQIFNCSVTGTINVQTSPSFAGGLAGFSSFGSIVNCSSQVIINAMGSTAGGLVGVNGKQNVISNCSSAGHILDSDPNNIGACLGGLAGTNSFGTISGSKSSVDVNSTSGSQLSSVNAGALTGTNYGKILNCFATGKVAASKSAYITAGGLVGANALGDVNDCYAAGDISFDPNDSNDSANFAGGLVGLNYDASVTRCYSKGLVGCGTEDQSDPNNCTAGGLAGLNINGNISASFWDIQTSGKTNRAGGKGLNSDQMKNISIYQIARWGGSNWIVNNGLDYPRLAWENTKGSVISQNTDLPYQGSGTQADPYRISSPNDFALLSWHSSAFDKHFVLTNDIDLQNIMVYPIGTFTGTFDGKGHVIRNVTIHQPTDSYIGLFSRAAKGAVITSLGIEDANIVGGDCVGILIAEDQGAAVSNCFSTGSANGFSSIGGLVGKKLDGTLDKCYSIADVTSWDPNGTAAYAGGLVGSISSGTISNCYSQSKVKGCSYAGGLVGAFTGTSPVILNCYAAGPVSSASLYVSPPPSAKYYAGGLIGGTAASASNTTCFWDTQTSGITILSTAGIGKTTQQMKTMSTYTSAGWDFSGETLHGTADLWHMPFGSVGYPMLYWQRDIAGDFGGKYGVGPDDFAVLASAWYSQLGDANFNPACDISQPADNIINELDLAVLASNWLNGL